MTADVAVPAEKRFSALTNRHGFYQLRYRRHGMILKFINNKGITLIELMVVAAVMAVGAIVAFCAINAILPDMRLKVAVRNLKSDLHMARLTAIRKNTFTVFHFNTEENSYAIYIDDGAGDHTKSNNYRRDPGEITIKKIRIHPLVNIYRAKFGSAAGLFAFNAQGNLDGLAGGIYLNNTMKSYRGVTVSRIGKITIKASDDGSKWHRLK